MSTASPSAQYLADLNRALRRIAGSTMSHFLNEEHGMTSLRRIALSALATPAPATIDEPFAADIRTARTALERIGNTTMSHCVSFSAGLEMMLKIAKEAIPAATIPETPLRPAPSVHELISAAYEADKAARNAAEAEFSAIIAAKPNKRLRLPIPLSFLVEGERVDAVEFFLSVDDKIPFVRQNDFTARGFIDRADIRTIGVLLTAVQRNA